MGENTSQCVPLNQPAMKEKDYMSIYRWSTVKEIQRLRSFSLYRSISGDCWLIPPGPSVAPSLPYLSPKRSRRRGPEVGRAIHLYVVEVSANIGHI